MKSIELKPVTKNDHQFLYDLLLKRNNIENISHKTIPSLKQHIKFVNSKPYKKWYVILHERKKIGSISLSYQDEIGMQMKNKIKTDLTHKKAIGILIKKNPRKRYLVNINPHNKKKISFFKKNNFKLIQYTYELELGD